MVLEFPAFVLIGVYSPATRDETRTEFRQGYIDAIDVRVRNLVAMGKQVFLCGDLNIIRSELDTAGLAEWLRKEAITLDTFISTPSRRFFNQLVFGGRVIGERDEGREEPILWDLCREFHPARTGMYTCWETRKNARPGNFGSRIDYVLCSSAIKDWFIDSNIQEGLLGSDHCPVYATINDMVNLEGAKVYVEDVMNPPGMFRDGKRLREWSPKDHLPTSAKLIPEFDRRQSIRDMFFKKSTPAAKTSSPSTPANNQDTGGAVGAMRDKEPADMSLKDSTPPASQQLSRAAASTTLTTTTPSNTAPAAPRKSPLPKRQAEYTAASGRPPKKGKAALNRENSTKAASGLAQSSLKGFFKPKTPTPDDSPANRSDSTGDSTPTLAPAPMSAAMASNRGPWGGALGSEPASESDALAESSISDSATEKVFDPIEAKESWSKLLGKRVVPKCEHGDECQMLVTKKAGINCGVYSFPIVPAIDSCSSTPYRLCIPISLGVAVYSPY